MNILKTAVGTTACALLIAAGAVTAADAAPIGAFASQGTASVVQVTPVVYGYGPLPYGLYGHRHRFRARRSYGTGYHGRGTATGGPVGGLPSRN